jgi:hypothetical protein
MQQTFSSKRARLSNLRDEHFEFIGKMETTPYILDPYYEPKHVSDMYSFHVFENRGYFLNLDNLENYMNNCCTRATSTFSINLSNLDSDNFWNYDHRIVKPYEFTMLKPIRSCEEEERQILGIQQPQNKKKKRSANK